MRTASLTPKEWFSGQLVQIKPKLRGWLHLAATPLSLAASIVLVCLAPTTPTKIGSAVYLACSLVLFGVSAAYHRFYWAPRWEIMWKRLDHSNIFLLIAGTYTPITIALLDRSDATVLLSVVWGGAAVGILLNLFWPTAPRWLTTLVSAGSLSGTCRSCGRAAAPASCGSSSPEASCTRWERSSTARRSPTPPPPGSASTKSFTPSPSPRGPATASPSTWRS